MARNGSGTYAIPNTYSDGQTITAAVVNANFSDIGSELTNSVARDGQTSMTGPLKAAPGSAAAPSLTFAADLDTGFFRKAANAIGIAVGGSEIAYIDEYGLSDATTGTTVINVMRYIPTSEHAAIEAHTSTTNVATYIQAAIDAAATLPRGVVMFPAGRYRCTSDLTVPCHTVSNWRGGVDLVGQGMLGNTEIELSGGAIVNGIHFNGSAYNKAGSIRNMAVMAHGGAVRGVTFENCSQPYMERVIIYGFAGNGLNIESCIMPTVNSCLIYGCGTASLAQVLLTGDGADGNTTTTPCFTGLYIGAGASGCKAGLELRQVANGIFMGGAIESCGVLIMIDGDATFDTYYTRSMTFVGVDIEFPTGHYIEIGQGMSTLANGPRNITFVNCLGSTSLSATVSYFAKLKNATGIKFDNTCGALSSGSEVAYYDLSGTCEGVEILPSRGFYNTIPWVIEGGTQRNDATPMAYWHSDHMNYVELKSPPLRSGTSIDCRLSAGGGIMKVVLLNNGGATNLSEILGGMAYAEIILFSINAATTLVNQSGVVANAIRTGTGSNVTMAGAKGYHLRYRPDFAMWFLQNT